MEFVDDVAAVVTAPRSNWDRWFFGFTPGTIFGVIFLILAMAMTGVEVARILTGSLNRNTAGTYGLYPGNLYFPPFYLAPPESFNFERRHQYLWPWSHPALLFAIPVLMASVFGFSSGRRGTYSTIYIFFAFSLISGLLSAFLIGYFATNLFRHNSGNTLWQSNENVNRDRSLTITMLAISALLALVSLFATIIGGIGFNCCTTKGGSILDPTRRLVPPAPIAGPSIAPSALPATGPFPPAAF